MAKKTLYIFNPEHDLALASGEMNYMPPASARRMASELALLPVWYAERGSAVLASSAYNLDYLKRMQELLDIPVYLMTEPELAAEPALDIRPWGWDAALRKRLSGLGVDESLLPSMQQISVWREYSHRSKSVSLLPELQLDEHFCGESYYLKTPEEWKSFVEEQGRVFVESSAFGKWERVKLVQRYIYSFLSPVGARVWLLYREGLLRNPYIIR